MDTGGVIIIEWGVGMHIEDGVGRMEAFVWMFLLCF